MHYFLLFLKVSDVSSSPGDALAVPDAKPFAERLLDGRIQRGRPTLSLLLLPLVVARHPDHLYLSLEMPCGGAGSWSLHKFSILLNPVLHNLLQLPPLAPWPLRRLRRLRPEPHVSVGGGSQDLAGLEGEAAGPHPLEGRVVEKLEKQLLDIYWKREGDNF